MREIGPRTDISAEDYIKMLPAEIRRVVEEIRRQKREGSDSASLAGTRKPEVFILSHEALASRMRLPPFPDGCPILGG